jgi:hypothetical protein
MALETLRPCSPRPVSPSELPGLDNKHLASIDIEDPFSDSHAVNYSSKPKRRWRSWRKPSFRLPLCVLDGLYAFVEEVRRWTSFGGGGNGKRGLGIRGRGGEGMLAPAWDVM